MKVDESCSFLKDPVSISELIGNGVNFEINTNFDEDLPTDLINEMNLDSEEDVEDDVEVDHTKLISPWTKPFNELKMCMTEINPYMWKRIVKVGDESQPEVPVNARVCIRYNAYGEGESTPFDSTFLRGSTLYFYTGRSEVLEGLEMAVCTMHPGEESQFIISYLLLYGIMGCPPRIKPKADSLFIVELISYNLVGDVNAEEQVPQEDRNKYSVMISKIKDIRKKGVDFFSQNMYRNAIKAFEKAANILKFCRVADEKEEGDQRSLLIALYTNLAVCYNKINVPTRSCIMCREIRNLTHNQPSCKALFQEGRALLMLGDYQPARNILVKAQYMEPNNAEISKELKILDERYTIYKNIERNTWTKALGIIDSTKESNANNAEENITALEQEMKNLMIEFKKDESQTQIKLPPGLTKEEIETVNALAKSMDLKLTFNGLDNTKYVINKINAIQPQK